MMKRLALAPAVAVALALPCPIWAQPASEDMYALLQARAQPGAEAEYGRAWSELLRPLVERTTLDGSLIAYVDLVEPASTERRTRHLQLYEFASWEAYLAFEARLSRALVLLQSTSRSAEPPRTRGAPGPVIAELFWLPQGRAYELRAVDGAAPGGSGGT